MARHERFAGQSAAYRASVLPNDIPKLAIEAAATQSWYRWVRDGVVIGIDRYGASAPYETVYTELGITVEKVVEAARGLVKAKR